MRKNLLYHRFNFAFILLIAAVQKMFYHLIQKIIKQIIRVFNQLKIFAVNRRWLIFICDFFYQSYNDSQIKFAFLIVLYIKQGDFCVEVFVFYKDQFFSVRQRSERHKEKASKSDRSDSERIEERKTGNYFFFFFLFAQLLIRSQQIIRCQTEDRIAIQTFSFV